MTPRSSPQFAARVWSSRRVAKSSDSRATQHPHTHTHTDTMDMDASPMHTAAVDARLPEAHYDILAAVNHDPAIACVPVAVRSRYFPSTPSLRRPRGLARFAWMDRVPRDTARLQIGSHR